MSKNTNWAQPVITSDFIDFAIEPVDKPSKKTKGASEGRKLRVKVKMTFAGLPTKNHAVYLPDEMQRGVESWMRDYLKPVQVHHDGFADAIGRVMDVRYVDTSANIEDNAALQPFSTDSTLLDRLKSAAKFADFAKDRSYQGVGHIEGLWDITDESAIQKILDGRYKTVSTAFTPDGAYCSVCAIEDKVIDWRVSTCDHKPGDTYTIDSKEYRCLAIPYNFDYYEVSFVNVPAATLAQVTEMGDNLSFEDSKFSNIDNLLSSSVIVIGERAYNYADSVSFDAPSTLEEFDLSQSNQRRLHFTTKDNVIDDSTMGETQSPTIQIGDYVMDEEMMKYFEEKFAALADMILSRLQKMEEKMGMGEEGEPEVEAPTEDTTSEVDKMRKELDALKAEKLSREAEDAVRPLKLTKAEKELARKAYIAEKNGFSDKLGFKPFTDDWSKRSTVDVNVLTSTIGHSESVKHFDKFIDAVRHIEASEKVTFDAAVVKAAKMYPALAKSNDGK